MRYFLDTEFNEDGRTIELISVGIVRQDFAWYYAVSSEFAPGRCNEWVQQHVLPNLWSGITGPREPCARNEIRDSILRFVGDDPRPEFWGYCSDYDWVAICQLFGPMVGKPRTWPYYCRDVKQVADDIGLDVEAIVTQTNQHNALADADWTRRSYLYLRNRIGAS
jgi:hypothetical protein